MRCSTALLDFVIDRESEYGNERRVDLYGEGEGEESEEESEEEEEERGGDEEEEVGDDIEANGGGRVEEEVQVQEEEVFVNGDLGTPAGNIH
uniref:Uncharacterized protein n=1 Tax=Chromera velia CCMP2878 TaxID=1169474 RepID=A0A0G4GNL6_9ALVE|eukprot:Cvel_4961.t1-p1 / transcript=Cvel_4961.t1 / gene=Cvel_4961 / organism=Chromera_velia_CCMP2878 / gene_product=hypothetical protein / transcript_product=hypothetical protein / location=Cvel_scaffold224:52493-58197(+) / protein_length=91 / sequence_SO=supercontig / SO=protein_coding / is_pseudo=false